MWDGDPVSLHPHPPVETARRLVDLIGAERIRDEGRRAIASGDYRWAAQILHALVFADPDDRTARELQADAYEQMGYQAEGPQWRGIFLTAARELRDGVQPATFATASPDTIVAMPIDILFDFAAVHLIGHKAEDTDLCVDFRFTDRGGGTGEDRSGGETWNMRIRRGVLNARRGPSSAPHLTVIGPKPALVEVLLRPDAAADLVKAARITLDGDAGVLHTLAGLLDDFDPDFPIVTP